MPLLAAGDEVVEASFTLPAAETKSAAELDREKYQVVIPPPKPIKFSADHPNWPLFMNALQALPRGTKVTLTLADGRTTTLEPVDAQDWFFADRGLIPSLEMSVTKAESLGQAVSLAGRETVDAVMQVYSFLRRIGTQISPFALGGPKTIAEAAGGAAYQGVPQLLIFLTLLSANLAVVNFLPIPLLDGGHMVFLVLEGIFRRPVSEKVVVAFHYLGFIFIISLMLFVLGLDFGLISRH